MAEGKMEDWCGLSPEREGSLLDDEASEAGRGPALQACPYAQDCGLFPVRAEAIERFSAGSGSTLYFMMILLVVAEKMDQEKRGVKVDCWVKSSGDRRSEEEKKWTCWWWLMELSVQFTEGSKGYGDFEEESQLWFGQQVYLSRWERSRGEDTEYGQDTHWLRIPFGMC